MPIECHEDGGMTITGDSIENYRLLTLHRGLRLQAKTGMKLTRGSLVKVAQSMGFVGRTAKTLLRDMENKLPQLAR